MIEAEKQALLARLSAGRRRNFRRYGRVGGPGKGTTGRATFGYYWDGERLILVGGQRHSSLPLHAQTPAKNRKEPHPEPDTEPDTGIKLAFQA